MRKSERIKQQAEEMYKQMAVINAHIGELTKAVSLLQFQVSVLNKIDNEPEKSNTDPDIFNGK